jgi:hypothetical protein
MDHDVIEARYVSGYVIWLKFRDGTQGEIDLGPELIGPVFEPLRDPEFFKRFRVDQSFARSCGPAALTLPLNSCTTLFASPPNGRSRNRDNKALAQMEAPLAYRRLALRQSVEDWKAHASTSDCLKERMLSRAAAGGYVSAKRCITPELHFALAPESYRV